MAEFESDLKGERLRAKFDQLADKAAVKGGGIRAFGFKRDGKAHDKREAKLINEAADRLLAGESTAAITRDWHDRGIRIPAAKRRPKGNPWTATKLHPDAHLPEGRRAPAAPGRGPGRQGRVGADPGARQVGTAAEHPQRPWAVPAWPTTPL